MLGEERREDREAISYKSRGLLMFFFFWKWKRIPLFVFILFFVAWYCVLSDGLLMEEEEEESDDGHSFFSWR